jgi:hypothetical protein
MRRTASPSFPNNFPAIFTPLAPHAKTCAVSPAAAAAFTALHLIHTSLTLDRPAISLCKSAASQDIRPTSERALASAPRVVRTARQHALSRRSITADAFGRSDRTDSTAETSAIVAAAGFGGVHMSIEDSRRCKRVRVSSREWPHEQVVITAHRCCDFAQQQGAQSQKHCEPIGDTRGSASTSGSMMASCLEGASRSSRAPSTVLPHAVQTTPQDNAAGAVAAQRAQWQEKP